MVIGAASRVRYSATVTALTAADAHAVFDEKRLEATRQQERLPSLLVEMEALKVGEGRGEGGGYTYDDTCRSHIIYELALLQC